MRQTVIHLEQFYASRLGAAAGAMVGRRLQNLWPDLAGRDVLGYGYGWPYLSPYSQAAQRVVLAMPAAQGALAQSCHRGIITCLTEDARLPFADGSFDDVLVAHGVEEAPDLNALLAELWRVTKPEGRIVVLASNRSGLWARSDNSPFGAGRPFSRSQLRGALRDVGFVPTVWSGALFVPPMRKLATPSIVRGFERFGELVWPSFSGLILVEALKRVYAGTGGKTSRLVMRPSFGGAAIGSPASNRGTAKCNGPKETEPS